MTITDFISIILYLAVGVFFYIGTYILSLNRESILNRAFFGLSLSAALWAFSFSIANNAESIETALFWRRISTMGWGLFFSLMLDFVLVLTSWKFLMRNKWIYAVIYLPSFINLWVFALYTPIVNNQYNLVMGKMGWIHVTENTSWEIFFRFYYIIFIAITVVLLVKWGFENNKSRVLNRGTIIGISIASVSILGSLTNFVLNLIYNVQIPQLEPVFIVIPMIVMRLSINEFGFKSVIPEEETYIKGRILSIETHEELLVLISKLYMLAAYVIFGLKVFNDGVSLNRIFPITSLMFFIGAFILFGMSLKISSELADKIVKVVLLLTIPVIGLLTISDSGIYGLAVPIVIILLAVTFNDESLIKQVIVVTVVTFVTFAFLQPQVEIKFETVDHLGRLIVFGMIAIVGIFINKIYVKRIKYIETQITIEKFMRHVFELMINVSNEETLNLFNRILKKMCEFYEADLGILLVKTDQLNYEHTFSKVSDQNDASITIANRLKIALALGESNLESMCYDLEISKSHKIEILKNDDKVIAVLLLGNINKSFMIEGQLMSSYEYLSNRIKATIMKIDLDKKIQNLMYMDSVTEIPGRRYLDEYLNTMINQKKSFALVLIGIDNLNKINEVFGYQEGDSNLRKFASRIDDMFSMDHLVTKFSSDIFAVVLPDYEAFERFDDIIEFALSQAQSPGFISNQPLLFKLSIGISLFKIDEESNLTASLAEQQADLALDYCRDIGGNKIIFYNDQLSYSLMEVIELERDLENAIRNQQFVLHYQPKIDIRTNSIIGMEALIRWYHPERGIIPPDSFLPIAEKNGWISDIDVWVTKEALKQREKWLKMGVYNQTLSINLTPITMMNQKYMEQIMNIILEYNLDGIAIEIEITETTSFTLDSNIISIINEIRNRGIRVALDDFGVAYSSLSRLHHLPIDHIKIDKKFVNEAVINDRGKKVLKNIINMGIDLELELTAEGVETEQQLRLLKELGCYQVQGYYFYRPLPADEIELLFKS